MGIPLAKIRQFRKMINSYHAVISRRLLNSIYVLKLPLKCCKNLDLKAHRKIPSIVFPILVLVGCSTDPQISPTSRMSIQPESLRFDVDEVTDSNGNCIFIPEFFQDVPVNLAIVNANDQAVGDSRIAVYLDFSGNTFSGLEVLQLFADNNGNGVIDPTDELITGIGDDAVVVQTTRFGGNALLLLRINLSCGFRGNLFAFSGPVAGSSQVEVVSSGE